MARQGMGGRTMGIVMALSGYLSIGSDNCDYRDDVIDYVYTRNRSDFDVKLNVISNNL